MLQTGWTIVFIIALVIAYATMGLVSDGFWGKTAFVVSLPVFVPTVLIVIYSGSKMFGDSDIYG